MFQIPKTEERITKELLLSKNSEETYMTNYLHLPIIKGLQVNPMRNDKKPTASFYRNKNNDLIFHDFSGSFSGNFISVVMNLYSCSYYKALKIIANDFGIVESKGYEKHIPEIKLAPSSSIEKQATSIIQVQIKEFSKKELDWWNSFGISINTLKKFNIVSCENSFLNGNYFSSSSESSPMYGYFGGKKDGIELWRIYMPTRKTYRFLSNWKGSLLQGAKQLPKSGEFLVITKSLKDVACMYEFGIPAIAPCSENSFVTEAQYNRLKNNFKRIFLLYDLDLPGVRASKKIKKSFPDIQVLLMPKKFKCKDFSDFVKKYDTLKTFDLIDFAKSKFEIVEQKSTKKTKQETKK